MNLQYIFDYYLLNGFNQFKMCFCLDIKYMQDYLKKKLFVSFDNAICWINFF